MFRRWLLHVWPWPDRLERQKPLRPASAHWRRASPATAGAAGLEKKDTQLMHPWRGFLSQKVARGAVHAGWTSTVAPDAQQPCRTRCRHGSACAPNGCAVFPPMGGLRPAGSPRRSSDFPVRPRACLMRRLSGTVALAWPCSSVKGFLRTGGAGHLPTCEASTAWEEPESPCARWRRAAQRNPS